MTVTALSLVVTTALLICSELGGYDVSWWKICLLYCCNDGQL